MRALSATKKNTDDELLTMAQAVSEFLRPPSKSTFHRWASQGTRGCKLVTRWAGGVRVVSRRAIREFEAELNGETTG